MVDRNPFASTDTNWGDFYGDVLAGYGSASTAGSGGGLTSRPVHTVKIDPTTGPIGTLRPTQAQMQAIRSTAGAPTTFLPTMQPTASLDRLPSSGPLSPNNPFVAAKLAAQAAKTPMAQKVAGFGTPRPSPILPVQSTPEIAAAYQAVQEGRPGATAELSIAIANAVSGGSPIGAYAMGSGGGARGPAMLPSSFRGSSSGKSYNAGQKYVSQGREYTANPDGTFTRGAPAKGFEGMSSAQIDRKLVDRQERGNAFSSGGNAEDRRAYQQSQHNEKMYGWRSGSLV